MKEVDLKRLHTQCMIPTIWPSGKGKTVETSVVSAVEGKRGMNQRAQRFLGQGNYSV